MVYDKIDIIQIFTMENIQPFIVNIIEAHYIEVIKIAAIFFLGRIILRKIVKRTIRLASGKKGESRIMSEKRAKTLGDIIVTTCNVVIYVIVILMLLNLFGVDMAPILAGIGILGLAVGFGAKNLVKDFISGLFILIEDQYSLGDKVQIGSFEGKVIKITIRSTVLRNEEGKILYAANGSINNAINLSQGLGRD